MVTWVTLPLYRLKRFKHCLQGAPDVDGRALREGLQALGQALRPDELAQLVRQLGGGRALGRAELAAGLLDWPALQASPGPLYVSQGRGFIFGDAVARHWPRKADCGAPGSAALLAQVTGRRAGV